MRPVALCQKACGLLIMTVFCSGWASGQDAGKILEQYLKAAGGSKVLSRIHTVALDGAIQASANQPVGTYTFIVKQPNRYYTEWRSGGKTVIEAYNGKSVW